MAWFNGSLYVGTTRDQMCVEGATRQRYNGTGYNTNPEKGVYCPPNPYDLDLRAEIWRYTPTSDTTGDWTMVYKSPVITNPADTSKTVALDIDYRGMIVYTPPGGEPALYVAATSAGSFIAQIQDNVAPRILRTTDGTNFTPITGAPYNIYTPGEPVDGIHPIGYRSFTINDNRLYVTAARRAASGRRSDGNRRSRSSDNPTFTQVTPNNFYVFETESFNNQLYIGNGDETVGYSVYRATSTDSAPYTFTPVVTDGGGRGGVINSVVSMFVFNDRLYVGTGGAFRKNIPVSELIRIAPDDSWELVVGKARDTTEGHLEPISTLPPGFGNVFNMLFWRMADYNNGIYVGTGDWSWLFEKPTIVKLLQWQFGFDVYGSCDGQYWYVSTINAFGDGDFNFGARTMLNTPIGGFIGSANFVQGTRVFAAWPGTAAPACSPFSISGYWSAPFNALITKSDGSLIRSFATPSNSNASFNPSDATSQPMLLMAEDQPGGKVLSWDPSAGAKLYRVYRAELTPNSKVGVPSPDLAITSPGVTLPEVIGVPDNGPAVPDVNILGPYRPIGVTTFPIFVDKTARKGAAYAYEVQAVSSNGSVSGYSNMIVSPSETENPTFNSVQAFIDSLLAKGQLTQDSAAALSASLRTAQLQYNNGSVRDALTTLGAMIDQVKPGSGLISDNVYAQELATQISLLQRSVALANIAATPLGRTNGGSIAIDGNTSAPEQTSSGGSGVQAAQNGTSSFMNPW